MSSVAVHTISELVNVDRVEGTTFAGKPFRTARGAMFGGQLVGQTLSAAGHTNDGYPWPTSLQLYFISAPDTMRDVHYTVTVRRDGGRYAWRHVLATQDDRVILEAMAAFQSVPPPTAPHPVPAGTPGPEDVASADQVIVEHGQIARHYYDRLGGGMMDTRFVQGSPPIRILRDELDPWHQIWLKPLHLEAAGPTQIGCVLAYLSDVNMLATPLLPFRSLGDGVKDYASSFDHNLRFYTPLESIDWLLFEQRSSTTSGSTLEAQGTLVTRDGHLVCSVNQQGLRLPVAT